MFTKIVTSLNFLIFVALTACNRSQIPSTTGTIINTSLASTPSPSVMITSPAQPLKSTLLPTTPSLFSSPTTLPTPLPPNNLKIEQLKMFSATTGWALHADFQAPYVMDGKILRTEQGIRTWTDVSPPTPGGYDNPPAVAFLDSNTALAIYSKSLMPKSPTREITIRRTSDGGRTWQTGDTITLDQGPLMLVVQIQLLDAQNGFMLAKDDGSMGKSSVYIFETHDGGMHWDIVYNSVDHMQMNDPDTLWVFGNYPYGGNLLTFVTKNDGFYSNGFLFVSHDRGKSWQMQQLSLPGDLADLESKVSKSELYLPTSSPRFVSATRGVLMRRIYTPDQVTVPPGSYNGLPYGEYLYFTEDGGQTWNSSQSPAKIGEAYFYQDQLAWFLGKDDADPATTTQLYQTVDNGKTWTQILSDSPFPLGSEIQFIDGKTGFSFDPPLANSSYFYSEFDRRSGKTFSIFSTTDSGHMWEEVVPKLAP
jgi:hypothetical protein